jgi:hypothetical protein
MNDAASPEAELRDAKLLAWIGFPPPPHRIRHGRPLWLVRGMQVTLIPLLFAIGLGILVAYFALDGAGRTLFLDSAYALGLGRAAPDASVAAGPCAYDSARAGSKMPGEWYCPVAVRLGGRETAHDIALAWNPDALAPRGAGTVFGAVAVDWPMGILVNRWVNLLPLLLFAALTLFGAITALSASRGSLTLATIGQGQVRTVDLLTWQGKPHFAFLDDAGGRVLRQADLPTNALILDGVRSMGAALVHGDQAVLLDAQLGPIELDADTQLGLLARVAQVQRQCQVRHALPPQPGDPATEQERIARIEAALKGTPDYAALYDETWRLVWDASVQDVADRALLARDVIALKLGPEKTADALDACRRRYAGQARPQDQARG